MAAAASPGRDRHDRQRPCPPARRRRPSRPGRRPRPARSRTRPAPAPPRPGRRSPPPSPACSGRRALWTSSEIAASSRSTSATSAVSPAASASRRSAVSGVRSRWDRSATRSRSAARSSSMRSASRLSARAASASSGVGPGSARASPCPAASARAVPDSSVASRVTERARRSAITTAASHQRDGDRRPAPARPCAPRRRAARSGTAPRTTDRGAVPVTNRACTARATPSRSRLNARPGPGPGPSDGARRPAWRRRRTVPSGSHTVMRPSARCPVLSMADGRRSSGVTPGSARVGASEATSRSARGDGPVAGHRPDQRPERQRERHHHQAGGGQHDEHEAAAHGRSPGAAGAVSLHADAPHGVQVAGHVPVSPSLRRSHDRWTSTVLSAPP